jgi:leucyl aminopeptidase
MQLNFAATSPTGTGALIIGVGEGGVMTQSAARVDKASGGALSRAMGLGRFTGKSGTTLEILAPAGLTWSRVVLAGLGTAADFTACRAEQLAATVTGKLLNSGESAATFQIEPPGGAAAIRGARLAAHLAFGARLACYRFDSYRRKSAQEHKPSLEKVTITTGDRAAAERAWQPLKATADGVFLARDLVNEPPNVLSPTEFASRAKALSRHGLKVEVLDEAAMKKLGMNALLGVGQGSARESHVVVLQWNGAKAGAKAKARPPVALVGKGVCFDSGGLSLKTGAGMMGMKGDMGGAAAVTGTMLALAARKARVNAVGVIGLVENMPGSNAQRPGDVVESMSGQTIEVLNTDAEGRLVLADVLWYTQTRFAPRCVIDLATLTGSIMASLGREYAGLFANDETLAARLIAAGEEAGEPVWRFPMGAGYDKLIKSKIADIKNIGGPLAGAIVAAQFLKRFIADDTVWAHLDIAGVAWQDSDSRPLTPGWATGWGVRVLNRLIAAHYEK